MKILSQTRPRTIQPVVMKQMNQLSLLTLIREHGPISRAALARLSSFSKSTVSAQVEALLQRRLVLETGTGKSGRRGGRKPTSLEFNTQYSCLAVGEIDSLEIRLAVADLTGSIIAKTHFGTEASLGAPHVTARLGDGLAKLLKRSGRAEQLSLIAIAGPGRVDVQQGVILDAGNIFDWRNVAIAEPLSSVFHVPVIVDNAVNLAALAEMQYGAASGIEDFVLVRHDTGIGCAVVLGGKLHRGSNWAAGEIAHFVLDLNKADQDWTPRGYLELQVGADRLSERISRTLASRNALRRFSDGGSTLGALFRAWKRKDTAACKIVKDLVLQLGVAIAHIGATYDPSLIVLQGEIFPPLLEEIAKVARRAVPWLPPLAVSKLGKESALRGAILAACAQAQAEIAKEISEGAIHAVRASGSELGSLSRTGREGLLALDESASSDSQSVPSVAFGNR